MSEQSKESKSGVEILLGPAGSGKTTICLEEWARHRPQVLLLVPTALAVQAIEERLAGKGLLPLWGRTIMTPEELARWVIRRAGRPERRVLTPTLKMLLLREVVEGLEIAYLKEVKNRVGFYNALGRFVSELKAADITPKRFTQACRRRKTHLATHSELADKDREVALIYEAFQGRLEQRGWAEEEDLIAEAASLLGDNPNLLGQIYGAVYVDGFWEFSGVQLNLLDSIAGAVKEVKVTLPLEEGRDAFAYVKRTLAQFTSKDKYRPSVRILTHTDAHHNGSLDYVERCIFTPPSEREKPDISEGAIVFLEAPGEEGEVEMVAREIRKAMEGSGVRPEEILVIARNFSPYSRYIGRYFREYGIPFALSAKVPLKEIPLARTLEHLLRVIGDGWQRADVLALLKSGYLPIDPDSANRIEMEARKRGIFRGREEWLRDFSPEGGRQLNADGDHPSTFSVARDEEAEANRQKNEALSLIVKVEEDLGKHPTPAAFRAGILGWLKDEVVQRRLATADAEMVRMDGLALLQIDELLREMEEAMGPDAGGLALKDLAKRLRLAIEAAWVECAAEQKGVLCLDVEQARHFEAEVVFVLGLNERFFPRPAQQEPFYADWERGDVRHLGGLGLQTSPWEAERERLLFYSAVTRARRNLYLCRPNTDNEGKELLESFFLYELKHLFSPESVKDQTRRRLIHEVVVEDPLTEREALNLAVVTGLEEGKELGLEGQASENLRTQIAEAARVAKRKTETQLAAGEFEAPEVISITSLETYASCPFKFYAQQILQLKPSEEIGPLERGQLLHKVLSRLLTKEKDWREERKDNLVVKARGILDEEVKTSGYGRRDEKGYRLGLLREGVLQLLDEFVAQELKLRFMLPEFRPACFELSFGYRASSTSEAFDDKGSPEGKQKASGIKPLPTVEPLIIGGSILLQGRIDRVDLEEGSKNCVMFDYKSGSREFNADEMGQGTSLQLPLYLLAMTDIWHLKPLAGLFYTKEGPSSGIVWREMEGRLGFRSAPKKRMVVSDLEEVRKRVAPVVEELVGRIKQGVFPATPGERCRWCSFPSLCRQERLRQ